MSSCLTIFIGHTTHCSCTTQGSHIDLPLACIIGFNCILVKLPGICVTLFACLPLPSLFVRYAHLIVMISLSRERGLLWLRHEPLQSLALRFGTNAFLLLDPLYNWRAKCLFSFSQDCSLLSGSLALEARLIGVHCKKRYINV